MAALAALSAAILAALAVLYRADLPAQRSRALEGSRIAATACGPVEHQSFGAGPVLLLVHGGAGGIDQTREYAERLAASGLRVVTVSRFGYLGSPLPQDGSPAAQADAYACLLDALGIARAAIAGVSAGTPSTLQFALRHGARTSSVVLVAPAVRPGGRAAGEAGLPARIPAPVRWFVDAFGLPGFPLWVASRAVHWSSADPERRRLARLIAQPLPLALREPGLKNDFAVLSAPQPLALERIAVPALVISAADDHRFIREGARHAAARIPGARHVELPDGGHFWIGRNDEVLRLVADFTRSGLEPGQGTGPPAR